MSDTLT